MKQNKALKQIKHNFQCSQQKLEHFKYSVEYGICIFFYIASGMLFHVQDSLQHTIRLNIQLLFLQNMFTVYSFRCDPKYDVSFVVF